MRLVLLDAHRSRRDLRLVPRFAIKYGGESNVVAIGRYSKYCLFRLSHFKMLDDSGFLIVALPDDVSFL